MLGNESHCLEQWNSGTVEEGVEKEASLPMGWGVPSLAGDT